MKVVIVDYGMGNIYSLSSALKFIGANEILFANDHESLLSADKIILPGVGNFGMASARIHELGLDSILNDVVIENKKPILGVCLGMQLLGLSSTENGYNKGLGFIDGICERFKDESLKVPHVGCNQVQANSSSKLLQGLDEAPDFYFTHSYRMTCSTDIGQSICDYGSDFVASFEHGHISGVQFHPELSQKNGLKLLKNFIDLF
jgi:imidazole glycerol-phosphate synthase subunit HisH